MVPVCVNWAALSGLFLRWGLREFKNNSRPVRKTFNSFIKRWDSLNACRVILEIKELQWAHLRCNFQIKDSNVRLPKMELTLKNIKTRLTRFEYLNSNGLYNTLHLQKLIEELDEIYHTARDAHKKSPSKEANDLLKEVDLQTRSKQHSSPKNTYSFCF